MYAAIWRILKKFVYFTIPPQAVPHARRMRRYTSDTTSTITYSLRTDGHGAIQRTVVDRIDTAAA